jgi:oligopeptide/dipeptide ABC transporter ATP-binding protein
MPRVDGATPTAIAGRVPTPGRYPPGCRFHPRCPYAAAECTAGPVELRARDGALARCVRADELVLGPVAAREDAR